jgi:hypothetical protein
VWPFLQLLGFLRRTTVYGIKSVILLLLLLFLPLSLWVLLLPFVLFVVVFVVSTAASSYFYTSIYLGSWPHREWGVQSSRTPAIVPIPVMIHTQKRMQGRSQRLNI